jgi:hypothetical protein
MPLNTARQKIKRPKSLLIRLLELRTGERGGGPDSFAQQKLLIAHYFATQFASLCLVAAGPEPSEVPHGR